MRNNTLKTWNVSPIQPFPPLIRKVLQLVSYSVPFLSATYVPYFRSKKCFVFYFPLLLGKSCPCKIDARSQLLSVQWLLHINYLHVMDLPTTYLCFCSDHIITFPKNWCLQTHSAFRIPNKNKYQTSTCAVCDIATAFSITRCDRISHRAWDLPFPSVAFQKVNTSPYKGTE